jgi:hypothetical protein
MTTQLKIVEPTGDTAKIDHSHENPIVAGFVENDYEYLYSSARIMRD